jgi:hypothetical protein
VLHAIGNHDPLSGAARVVDGMVEIRLHHA